MSYPICCISQKNWVKTENLQNSVTLHPDLLTGGVLFENRVFGTVRGNGEHPTSLQRAQRTGQASWVVPVTFINVRHCTAESDESTGTTKWQESSNLSDQFPCALWGEVGYPPSARTVPKTRFSKRTPRANKPRYSDRRTTSCGRKVTEFWRFSVFTQFCWGMNWIRDDMIRISEVLSGIFCHQSCP